MEKGSFHHLWSALAVFSLLLVGACAGSPERAPESGTGDSGTPPSAGPDGNGGTPPEEGEVPASIGGFDFDGSGAEFIQDILYLLGADRSPSRSLRVISDTHDLKTWTYKRDAPDGVRRTIEAIRDLRESDYPGWDDTSLVIAVLSTMSVRDPSALVRAECLETLSWFEGWVRPEVARLGSAVSTSEEAVIRALRALDELDKDPGPVLDHSAKLVAIDAISILGSHPWDTYRGADPQLVRSSLSRPRGVIRRLSARDLQPYRNDPEVRDTMDRALIRVTGEVLFMSLVASLADSVEHVRATGARKLRTSAEPRAVSHLAHALRQEDSLTVRLVVIASLEELAETFPPTRREAISALGSALTGSEDSVRRAAARALSGILDEGPPDDPAYWQRWWTDHSEEYDTP